MPASNPIFSGTLTQSTTATGLVAVDPAATTVSVVLSVTALGPDTSAAFRLQWSVDNIIWADASPQDAFAPITAPIAVVRQFGIKAKYWRAVCDLTGTNPTVTGSANSYS